MGLVGFIAEPDGRCLCPSPVLPLLILPAHLMVARVAGICREPCREEEEGGDKRGRASGA